MTLAFVMVCEDAPDFRTASGLADRVICEQVDWITPEVIADFRRWCGLDDSQPYLEWTRAKQLAREAGFHVHGHFEGKPGEPDAVAARRALWLIQTMKVQPDGVALIRDDDGESNRRDGLRQARAETSLPCPIVIGLSHLKRECWVLAGFEPATQEEMQLLTGMKDELSFDPRTQPERLTGGAGDIRHVKRVLRVLTNNDPEREQDCWAKTALALLRERGKATGLTDYLEEVRSRIIPLFTGKSAHQ